MADELIYKCDLCDAKFQTLDELRKHKSFQHSNNILQDNYVASTITSSNNEYQIDQNLNLPEFSQTSKNITNQIPTIETKNTYSSEFPINTSDVKLKEVPEPSAPLLSSNENVITEQPTYVRQQPYPQQSQRQQNPTSIYPSDPCCICCCQPTIHCDSCCNGSNDTSTSNNVVDGQVANNGANDCNCGNCCCECCCHICRTGVDGCDCGTCDCGECDCDCGDCDCGDCDCGSCDCNCGDCSIM